MAALVCEICGGKLIGKAGGVFECDSCGMEYDTAWAKEKIQQIKGTVRIEGPVEVQGTVRVEGSINKESLLKRGSMALEDGQWMSARTLFEQVMNMDPQCGEAYVGKLCAEIQIHHIDKLGTLGSVNYLQTSAYKRAVEFADAALVQRLLAYEKANREAVRQAQEEKDRLLREQQQKQLRMRRRAQVGSMIGIGQAALAVGADGCVLEESKPFYQNGGNPMESWRQVVAMSCSLDAVALRADGTVISDSESPEFQKNIRNWDHIVSVSNGHFYVVGLRSDGTVECAMNHESKKMLDVSGLHGITDVAVGYSHVIALQADGTVVTVGSSNEGQCRTQGWKDAVAVAARGYLSFALKADGTVLGTGQYSDDYTERPQLTAFRDIVAISTSGKHIAGLKSDGTVVVESPRCGEECRVEGWKDVVAIATGSVIDSLYTFGICADGKVLVAGKSGRINTSIVSGWKLFKDVDQLEEERKEAFARVQAADDLALRRAAEEAARKKAREEKLLQLQRLLEEKKKQRAALGIFDGKKKKELDAQIAGLEEEIRKM